MRLDATALQQTVPATVDLRSSEAHTAADEILKESRTYLESDTDSDSKGGGGSPLEKAILSLKSLGLY